MRTIFIILLFISVQFIAKAQDINYLHYHKNCRLAESYFLQDDTLQCINTYKETFDSFEILFPRDCFMAAQIAYKLNQDSMAVEFLLKAIPFGLRHEFFSVYDSTYIMDYEIRGLVETQYWSILLDQKDSLRQLYIHRVDWKLKSEIDKIMDEDRELRRRCNKTINRIFRPDLEMRFEKLNKEHMNFLDSIFHDKGYPGVWLLGIKDSLFPETGGRHNNANLISPAKEILYHCDSAYINYGGFLYQELLLGHIDSRTYAMIRDFNDRHLVRRSKNQKMYYYIWWPRNNFTEEEFRLHCFEIGCPTKQSLGQLSLKLGPGYDVFWWPFR